LESYLSELVIIFSVQVDDDGRDLLACDRLLVILSVEFHQLKTGILSLPGRLRRSSKSTIILAHSNSIWEFFLFAGISAIVKE
jgi:hypothetical protein